MKYNATVLLLFLSFFCLMASFAGTVFWHDGVIVRGPEINTALGEKLDTTGGAISFVTLTPTDGFATATAAVGTMYQNAQGEINFLSTGTTWLQIASQAVTSW